MLRTSILITLLNCTKEAVKFWLKYYQVENRDYITKIFSIEARKSSLKKTYFLFDISYYSQNYGTAMGRKVAPVLEDPVIYIKNHENTLMYNKRHD